MLGKGKVPCIALASDSSELGRLHAKCPHILGPRSGCQKSRSCAGAGWLCFFETANSLDSHIPISHDP